jgi:hypothetical protein
MHHMKNFWQACASVFLVTLLSGAAHADTPPQEFTAALQKWQTAGIHDYSFTLNQSCLCFGIQSVRITVKGDKVQSVSNAQNGSAVSAEVLSMQPTMTAILQTIEAAYTKPADHITLSLNADLGYPERVFIDYYVMMADEELIYEIRDFAH